MRRDVECESGQRDEPIADALAARNIPFFFATSDRHKDRKVLTKPFRLADLERNFRDLLTSETNDRKGE